jgi:hypothetical protein
MAVIYSCRHCHMKVGELNAEHLSEFQLGFHFLTPTERKDIISYSPEGDVSVKVICDYCRHAIETHPELSLLLSPLQ